MVPVSLLSVFAAGVAAFVLGFLWHGPVFGKMWMKLSKITEKDVKEAQKKGGMWKYMLAAFVQQLVTAFVLAQFLGVTGVTDTADAMIIAFWIWLGFIVTVALNGVLWEKRAFDLYLFNITYHLANIQVMAIVLSMWL